MQFGCNIPLFQKIWKGAGLILKNTVFIEISFKNSWEGAGLIYKKIIFTIFQSALKGGKFSNSVEEACKEG